MYPADDSECGPRQLIERQIVRSLIDEILGHGLLISINDGEEQHPITGDRESILAALMETDEDRVNIYSQKTGATPEPEGSVRLVYGNDGWDVICDYSLSVERFIEQANTLAEQLSETADVLDSVSMTPADQPMPRQDNNHIPGKRGRNE